MTKVESILPDYVYSLDELDVVKMKKVKMDLHHRNFFTSVVESIREKKETLPRFKLEWLESKMDFSLMLCRIQLEREDFIERSEEYSYFTLTKKFYKSFSFARK